MNWEKSEFKKIIGITQEHFAFIDKVRKKKSKAGKLKEIIEFYKKYGTVKPSSHKKNNLL